MFIEIMMAPGRPRVLNLLSYLTDEAQREHLFVHVF